VTKRERKYLFLISLLLIKIDFIKQDANDLITLMEEKANLKLAELLQKQVELDTQVLKVWEENAETIWQEKQLVEDKLAKMKQKHKERMRYEHE
jgi:hypothetical protein